VTHGPDQLTIRQERGNAERRNRRRRLLRYSIIVLIVLFVGFSAITMRWFIWPPQGMPARVDAIVMLDGPGDRLNTSLDLARERRAPVLVISYTLNQPLWSGDSVCAPKVAGVKVICFIANPPTTRGEAEFVGRIARQYHWHSIALVASAPQDPVALLRTSRCFSGKIYMINASFPASQWFSQVAHYWGATLEALFLQRSC
jgi:uncharacterized SAM-binding protein YcdF (DUF218 family)